MIHYTCFKCKRRFELDPIFVGYELNKLKKKNPSHYQAVCPACRAVNKVSTSAMQAELDSVADEVQKMITEEKEKAEAAKKAEPETEAAGEQGGKGTEEKEEEQGSKGAEGQGRVKTKANK